jgi:acetoin utilization deacetylase AcuC-like enzyme
MRCYYSPGYFVPLPQGHPFPIAKYRDSYKLLISCPKRNRMTFHKVQPADMADILRVHDPEYLDAIQKDRLSEFARNRLGLPHHPRFLERSLLDVAGTIAASESALTDGVAWNLGGGTHHAMPAEGLGFCITNDVAVAAVRLKHLHPDLSILILDTDAHQGNGNHRILRDYEGIYTYSIHVGANYPAIKEAGDHDVPLPRYVDGEIYLLELRRSLRVLKTQFTPDIVFWISGADVHEGDRFGQMKLSTEAVAERDRMIVETVAEMKSAMVGTYGGGYNVEDSLTPLLHANAVRSSIDLLRKRVDLNTG